MASPSRFGAVLASVGTTAQIVLTLSSDPATAAAHPWLACLGLAAGSIADLGIGLFGSAIDRRHEAKEAVRDLVTNEHLARAQAAAIRRRLETVAGQGKRRGALLELAEDAPRWWIELFREPLRDLQAAGERAFVTEIANDLAGDGPPRLDKDAWIRLLDAAHALSHGGALDPALCPLAAEALAEHFVSDTVDELKRDLRTGGEAFAVVSLRFSAEVLIGVRSLESRIQQLDRKALEGYAGLASKLDQALQSVAAGAAALQALGSLPAEVRTAGARIEAAIRQEFGRMRPKLDEIQRDVRELLRRSAPVRPQRRPLQRLPRSTAGELIGRDALRRELVERLRARRERIDVWGLAGMGKTALAAEALFVLFEDREELLDVCGYPDGVIVLDLYRLQGDAERAWNELAAIFDPSLPEDRPPRERAQEACRGRRALVVLEGAEELGSGLTSVLSVLPPESVKLILTRDLEQTGPHPIKLKEALELEEGVQLLRLLCGAPDEVLRPLQELLEGHPLALTWAGAELGRETQAPGAFLAELRVHGPLGLHDPQRRDHTLEWLFERTVGKASPAARIALGALGSLAHAPVNLTAVASAFSHPESASAARQALQELVLRALVRLVDPDREAWQLTHVLAYRFARSLVPVPVDDLQRLASWCSETLGQGIADARLGVDQGRLQRALGHAEALLGVDTTSQVLSDLAKGLLCNVTQAGVDLGNLGLASLCLHAVAAWMDRASPEIRATPIWRRERAVAFAFLGDVQLAQGDLVGTLASYQASRKIREKLAVADASDAGRQRDLSVSFERVGDVQFAQGDLVGALASYQASRKIAKKLAAADASNAGSQRDLSVSHNKVGDVQRAQGDLVGALASYQASRKIAEKLAAADASNADWQRDLSVSQNKVGDVRLAQGDLVGALTSYQASRKIREKLAAADASNAGWQRDLSVSHNKVGDVQLDQGDLGSALASYQASQKIAEKLAAADASNAGWQRDLSVSHDRVGDVQLGQGDLGGALTSYQASREIREKLAAADASNAGWQRNVAVSLAKVGDVQRRQSNLDLARECFQRGLEIVERLAVLDPTNAVWRRDVDVFRRMLDECSGAG